MAPTFYLLGTFLIIILMVIGLSLRKKYRRQKLQNQSWPHKWENWLQELVPLYRKLPQKHQRELQGLVQIFLAEKYFEGCGGLQITEEMKVLIATQACILLLNRKTNLYPRLQTVIVYPSAFVARGIEQTGWGGFVEKEQARLGESWHQGMVVLAWDHINKEAHDANPGHNVVLHEFAHQLDQEDGRSDGAPLLEKGAHYTSWAQHLGEVYEELQTSVRKHEASFLDQYGATNPAEFFAVITETFFEKPIAMQKKLPDLYQELSSYYQLDPATW